MSAPLVKEMASRLGITHDEADSALSALVSELQSEMARRGQVMLPGLGILRHSGSMYSFEPDRGLSMAVNKQFLGLKPESIDSDDDVTFTTAPLFAPPPNSRSQQSVDASSADEEDDTPLSNDDEYWTEQSDMTVEHPLGAASTPVYEDADFSVLKDPADPTDEPAYPEPDETLASATAMPNDPDSEKYPDHDETRPDSDWNPFFEELTGMDFDETEPDAPPPDDWENEDIPAPPPSPFARDRWQPDDDDEHATRVPGKPPVSSHGDSASSSAPPPPSPPFSAPDDSEDTVFMPGMPDFDDSDDTVFRPGGFDDDTVFEDPDSTVILDANAYMNARSGSRDPDEDVTLPGASSDEEEDETVAYGAGAGAAFGSDFDDPGYENDDLSQLIDTPDLDDDILPPPTPHSPKPPPRRGPDTPSFRPAAGQIPPRERGSSILWTLVVLLGVIVVGASIGYYFDLIPIGPEAPAEPQESLATTPPSTTEMPDPATDPLSPTPSEGSDGSATPPADPQGAAGEPSAADPDPSAPSLQPPAPAATAASGIDRTAGGWTVIVASETSRADADAEVQRFASLLRERGYPVDILTGTDQAGRTRYRVAFGQFRSREAGLVARQQLSQQLPNDAWLLRIQPDR